MEEGYKQLLSKITERKPEVDKFIEVLHSETTWLPGKPYYLPEMKNGKHTGAYTINNDVVAMGLSLRSLYLVSQYIPLSDEEAQAIAYHDGMYVPEGRAVAHKETPLLLLLHWADMWTASVREKKEVTN
jgi:hypothetical protein